MLCSFDGAAEAAVARELNFRYKCNKIVHDEKVDRHLTDTLEAAHLSAAFGCYAELGSKSPRWCAETWPKRPLQCSPPVERAKAAENAMRGK